MSLKTSLWVTGIFLMLTSLSGFAAPTIKACEEKQGNDKSYNACLDNVLEKKNREMQLWVNNQTFSLEDLADSTGRTSALNTFKRSQKDFITYRENNCRWYYLVLQPKPEANPAYKSCLIYITQLRINELEAYNGN